jgi:hypothetical protein
MIPSIKALPDPDDQMTYEELDIAFTDHRSKIVEFINNIGM